MGRISDAFNRFRGRSVDASGQYSYSFEAKKASPLLVSLSAIFLGLVAGALLILLIGANPIDGYKRLITGAFNGSRRFANTLAMSTQLILIGLSVAFAFKTGLFNIGGSGQMLVGGITGSILAHYLPASIPRPLFLIIFILAAACAGAFWGFISGFLKAKFNVHEVVSSIMLNWSAYWLVYDFIPRFIVDPSIAVKSKPIPVERTLRADWFNTIFGRGQYLNYGIIIAIIACFLIWFILNKTTLGFNLKAVGSNRFCAEYAGIKVNRSIIISMSIAGCLSGLAGLTYYCGYSNIMEMAKMPNDGFDGIAVALLGNCTPVGVFFAAIFFGALKMGKGSLITIGIPTELADTIIAIIIYFTATNVILAMFWNRIFKKNFEKKEAKLVLALDALGLTGVDIGKINPKDRRKYIKMGKELYKAESAFERAKEKRIALLDSIEKGDFDSIDGKVDEEALKVALKYYGRKEEGLSELEKKDLEKRGNILKRALLLKKEEESERVRSDKLREELKRSGEGR